MQPIKKLTIKGFRGIRNKVILELDGNSFLLLAENSRGKTSVTDGVEWFLSPDHTIDRLSSEGTGCNDYPHIGLNLEEEEALVSIEFTDSPKPLEKKFDSKRITQPSESDSAQFQALYADYVVKPWLRYWDVASFVLQPKAKKYEKLAEWMGFEDLLNEQLMLKDAQETVKSHLKGIDREIDTLKSNLKEATGISRFTDSALLTFCNEKLKELNRSEVASHAALVKTLEQMHVEQLTERAVRATKLIEVEKSLGDVTHESFAQTDLQCISDGLALEKDSAANREMKIESLYQAGMGIITGDSAPEGCPLCMTPWEQTHVGSKQELLLHIKGELEKLDDTKRKVKSLKEASAVLQGVVVTELRNVESMWLLVQQGYGGLSYCFIPIAKALHAYLMKLREFKKLLAEGKWTEAEKLAIANAQQVFKEAVAEYRKLLLSEKEQISLSEDEEKMSEQVAKLNNICENWGNLIATEKRKDFVSQEADKFSTICSTIGAKLEASVQNQFNEIAALVQEYFEKLRPSDLPQNGIKEIRLEIQPGRAAGRSAEVEFSFHEIAVTPPKRVMTESHLNALGIAIYLALIRKLNPDTKMLVLDDVINSFDQEHRYYFAELLAEKFNDFQLLIFTHDSFTFDLMDRAMPKAVPQHITSWHFEHGVSLKDYSSYLEDVERSCTNGKPLEAGRTLGAHVDRELNILCEKLCAKTTHRYTVRQGHNTEDLRKALLAVLKKELKCDDALLNKFDDTKLIQFVRNFCSHEQLPPHPTISTDEVRAIKSLWENLSAEFRCNECRTFVSRLPMQSHAQCRCRKLQMPPVPSASTESLEEEKHEAVNL